MAKEYESAIGLVVAIMPKGDTFKPNPFATAWAFGTSLFATNSHITKHVKELLDSGIDVFIILNRNPDKKYRVVGSVSHPRYGETKRNYEGKESFAYSYDVGILKIEGSAPKHFPIANVDELKRIGPGYRIAYLGFPMEELIGDNINVHSPIATMQSGIVTSISDYWQGDSGFASNLLIGHNLGATGGASGSPLFNTNGEVVGILNGGNIVGQIVFDADNNPKVIRAPSAAMVNFGQRVDLLEDLLRQ